MHSAQVCPACVRHQAPCGSRRYCLDARVPSARVVRGGAGVAWGAPTFLDRKTRSNDTRGVPCAQYSFGTLFGICANLSPSPPPGGSSTPAAVRETAFPQHRPEPLELGATRGALWRLSVQQRVQSRRSTPWVRALGCPMGLGGSDFLGAEGLQPHRHGSPQLVQGWRWLHLAQVLPVSVQHRAPSGSRRFCWGGGGESPGHESCRSRLRTPPSRKQHLQH